MKTLRYLIPVPFMVMLLLFQIAPAGWVVMNGFQSSGEWTLDNFREIAGSAFFLQSFWNSLAISFWSSFLGLGVAVIAAYSLRRVPGRLQGAVLSFSNMVSNFSGVPLAFAFIIILGTNGCITLILRHIGVELPSLYSRGGLILLYTYFQIPLGILLIYPAFDALNDDWQEAAFILGASFPTYARRVVGPILAPACLNTFILLYANAIGAYATVYALTTGNYNLLTIRIASLVAGDVSLEPELAAALAVCLVVIMVAFALLRSLIARRYVHVR